MRSDVVFFIRQPHDLVLPRRFEAATVFCSPQSQATNQRICPCLSRPTPDKTVNRPKRFPVRSINPINPVHKVFVKLLYRTLEQA